MRFQSSVTTCLQGRYYELLRDARRKPQDSDTPAICRLRRLAPAIDVLPVAKPENHWCGILRSLSSRAWNLIRVANRG